MSAAATVQVHECGTCGRKVLQVVVAGQAAYLRSCGHASAPVAVSLVARCVGVAAAPAAGGR